MRNIIRKLIIENDIDEKCVVIGTGKTYCKSKGYFIFQAGNNPRIRNKTAKIAIKYFETQKLIIVWNVVGKSKNRMIKRESFSIKIDSVFENLENGVAKKIVELPGRGEEDVWLYPVDELEQAIIKIKECLK